MLPNGHYRWHGAPLASGQASPVAATDPLAVPAEATAEATAEAARAATALASAARRRRVDLLVTAAGLATGALAGIWLSFFLDSPTGHVPSSTHAGGE